MSFFQAFQTDPIASKNMNLDESQIDECCIHADREFISKQNMKINTNVNATGSDESSLGARIVDKHHDRTTYCKLEGEDVSKLVERFRILYIQ